MSDSTIIRLPLHTPTQYVLLAVAAAFGAVERVPLESDARRSPPPDLTQPCAENNLWYLEAKGRSEQFWFEMRGGKDISTATFYFHDSAGARHDWLVMMDGEDEQWRSLATDSNALSVALGERLVRLFGGELLYSSRTDLPQALCVRRPTLPLKRHETPNERFRRFENVIAETCPLTAEELMAASSRSAYGVNPPRVSALLPFLQAKSAHISLDRAMPSAPPRNKARI